jgi:hypothetical protein
MKWIDELRDKHLMEDIYVIGSGKSLDFYPPNFFEGRITIGVNDIWKKFKTDYIIRKDRMGMEESVKTGIPHIISEWDCGGRSNKNTSYLTGDNIYFYKHKYNGHTNISIPDDDELIVSYSTITSGIHLAAWMGASTIFIVGHDCGSINGEVRFKENGVENSGWGTKDRYYNWLLQIEGQTIWTKKFIGNKYGCNIVGLMPFVSLRLEGNKYE